MITRRTTQEIKPGKWKDEKTGQILIVTGVAPHTEADYRLVLWHSEEEPKEIKATPESVFNESFQAAYRFRQIEA